jgi:hypothetical protein
VNLERHGRGPYSGGEFSQSSRDTVSACRAFLSSSSRSLPGGRPAALSRVSSANDASLLPTRDHIHPRSKGGTLAHGKALACLRCDGDKGSRTLGSWLYRLRKAGDRRADIVAEFMATRGAFARPSAVAISPEA